MEPLAILGRNEPVPQILIRWSYLPDADATWEDYEMMRQQFPTFIDEDNSNFEGGAMS